MLNNVQSALENPITVPVILLALLVLGAFWTLSAVASDRRARKPMFSDNRPLNALGWFGMLLSPFGAVILVAVMWELLALAWSYPILDLKKNNAADIRWHGSIMLAMLAALGALFTLLFAYIRVFTTERQTKAAERQARSTDDALFNDKINAAADDLHARRLVTKNPDEKDDHWDYWQDDIVKRNAAIDRLETLAIERPDIAPRIARMLSIYLRELSREHPPRQVPEPDTGEDLGDWVQSLKPPRRSDMENATQTLGRLRKISGVDCDEITIDLRGANLQGFDLHSADLTGANLSGARMQGADLIWAQMQGADLGGARMQGAGSREQGAGSREQSLAGRRWMSQRTSAPLMPELRR